jgi:hypothetical protein
MECAIDLILVWFRTKTKELIIQETLEEMGTIILLLISLKLASSSLSLSSTFLIQSVPSMTRRPSETKTWWLKTIWKAPWGRLSREVQPFRKTGRTMSTTRSSKLSLLDFNANWMNQTLKDMRSTARISKNLSRKISSNLKVQNDSFLKSDIF